jgi:hypothetical protein
MFYTYAHYRKSDDVLFYIGKGSTNRASTRRKRNPHWNNIVNKHGFYYKILERFESEDEALKKEEELISFYRAAGVKLANVASGGTANSGPRHSEEVRRQMSVARKGKKRAHRWNHSEETKEKMRVSHTGLKKSKECIEKQRAALTGVPKSEAHRAALSKARTGLKVPKIWRKVLCSTNGVLYKSLTDAASCLDVDISHISKCCRGKIKQIKGYSFEYIDAL